MNAFYQFGSYNQRPQKCEMIRCYQDYSMDAVGCHTKELKTGCTASPTDFSKNYPDCCPRITCTPTTSTTTTHKPQLRGAQSNLQVPQSQQTVTKGWIDLILFLSKCMEVTLNWMCKIINVSADWTK